MNMNGKPVGNCQLVRKDGIEGEEEEERVFVIKGKKETEILFEPGQQLSVGTKQVQVLLTLFAPLLSSVGIINLWDPLSARRTALSRGVQGWHLLLAPIFER